MSSILPAGKTVETLEALKANIEDIAARAAKLNEQFRAQTAREQRRFEATLEEEKSNTQAGAGQNQADFETAKQQAKAAFERRTARIGTAYQAAKDHKLKAIDDSIGALKYDLQKRMLQAERDRQSALAESARRLQEFQQTVASEEQALSEVERAAQRAFIGYGGFQRAFAQAYEGAGAEFKGDENQLLAELREMITKGTSELSRFRHVFLLRLFRYIGLWVFLVLCLFAIPAGLTYLGRTAPSYVQTGLAAVGALALILLARFVSVQRARALVLSIARVLARARHLHDACLQQATLHHNQEVERIGEAYASSTGTVDQKLKDTVAKAGERRVSCRMESDQRAVRANARNEHLYRTNLERLDKAFQESVLQGRQAAGLREAALREAWEARRSELSAAHASSIRSLQSEWDARIRPLYESLQKSMAAAGEVFPDWSAPFWRNWQAPKTLARAARFASLEADLTHLPDQPWSESGFVLPGPTNLTLPLCLVYPQQGSVLIETDSNTGHDRAVGTLNTILLRLLSNAPPGRLAFTILDPVGLGQNFAGVMHLADHEEQLINSRIWTQSTQIEEKLAELNEHMEKVIQMYLRNEYKTIAEYNEQAGVIAEKYHFLVVADFPANFTDVAAKRLLSIAASGARCGVFTLIHWDRRHPLPQDFIPDELRKSSFGLSARGTGFVHTGKSLPGTELILDEPPSAELATEFIQQVGRLSRDSSRVEVPFEHVTPSEEEIWSEETTQELRVPIGRTGATKLQYLEIGKGTRQHGLVAGKTGSGKSTLFHVIITNLSLWCSPEQVEFYLVDFKKGVEFKCYAAKHLPHARVVAIESDREFGLSVLQRVDEELRRRGDLFRQLGVQDIPGYKRAGGQEPMPRTLLLVDEFQEFFVEDDKVSQTASMLLDRIVRQGRAFGIHVLLGSQTLGGAYTVARTTLGQMVVRVALQCNEADAHLIMDENNPAPRLLSRPGEGIYNDMAGALEGNSPFQVVWLPDSVRDAALDKIRARADQAGDQHPDPIVFEGNAPAEITGNTLLRRVLEQAPQKPSPAPRVWLGAPNSIKGPTEVVFHRQSGNNLLIVGQREEAALAMISASLVALSAQFPVGAARFLLLDSNPPGTPARDYLERIVSISPHPIQLLKASELTAIMTELIADQQQRSELPDPDSAPPVFFFINGIQKFSRLRFEEDFGFAASEGQAEIKPGAALNQLVCEGTRLGFHVIATCDTYNNLSRFLSRKAISEFEMRVLFQMSANDSASLIDNPKAGMLGLHRALYFNAQEGYLETFRPYALPGNEWLEDAARKLKRS